MSNRRPSARLRHSLMLQSNQITASSPLGIRVVGGTSFKFGWTSKIASFNCFWRSVSSSSSSGSYPLKAFSNSFA